MKDYSIMFNVALDIANLAHARQKTRNGDPYILHPMQVALFVETMRQKVIAILHDAIEDAEPDERNWVANEIRGLGDGIYDDVVALTRDEGIEYSDYVDNLVRHGSTDAIMVKLADLKHNMDLGRLHTITNKDIERNKKYSKVNDHLTTYLEEMQ